MEAFPLSHLSSRRQWSATSKLYEDMGIPRQYSRGVVLYADENNGDGGHGKDGYKDIGRQTVVDRNPGPWI